MEQFCAAGGSKYGCGYEFEGRVQKHRKIFKEEIKMNGCFDTLQNNKTVCVCDSDGCTSPTNGSILKKVSLVLFSLVSMRFAF